MQCEDLKLGQESLNFICNGNINNMPPQELYDSFNNFIFNKDLKVIGKLLKRYEFYQMIKCLAGDIVELGVYKGSGMASFIKFLMINETYSNRKVIGFDLFDVNNDVVQHYSNGIQMKAVYNRTSTDDLSYDSVTKKLTDINPDNSKFILVKGDVCTTTLTFAQDNPGFRISLLYVDLDLDEPVYTSLKNLWPKIVPGGYIIFDEYEYHKFDESNGVDRFLREMDLAYEIRSTHFMAPSAYMIKKSYIEYNVRTNVNL